MRVHTHRHTHTPAHTCAHVHTDTYTWKQRLTSTISAFGFQATTITADISVYAIHWVTWLLPNSLVIVSEGETLPYPCKYRYQCGCGSRPSLVPGTKICTQWKLIALRWSKTEVLNLCVLIPLGTEWPCHRVCLRQSENTDIYITIHNSNNIIVTK